MSPHLEASVCKSTFTLTTDSQFMGEDYAHFMWMGSHVCVSQNCTPTWSTHGMWSLHSLRKLV